jgi:hypothetical protein
MAHNFIQTRKQTKFFILPAELRNRIYELTCTDEEHNFSGQLFSGGMYHQDQLTRIYDYRNLNML